jgi:hypothetical protein
MYTFKLVSSVRRHPTDDGKSPRWQNWHKWIPNFITTVKRCTLLTHLKTFILFYLPMLTSVMCVCFRRPPFRIALNVTLTTSLTFCPYKDAETSIISRRNYESPEWCRPLALATQNTRNTLRHYYTHTHTHICLRAVSNPNTSDERQALYCTVAISNNLSLSSDRTYIQSWRKLANNTISYIVLYCIVM